MKFSKWETLSLLLAVAAVCFLGGFFARGQYEAGLLYLPEPTASVDLVPIQSAVPVPSNTPAQSGPVNINTADAETLQTLPGIGPQRAENIIVHRETYGPFPVPEALSDVPGIGPAILAGCIDFITVED